MNYDEVQKLLPGDHVAYVRWQWSTIMEQGISTVEKVNGHGHIILVDGKQFDKHGHERKKGQYGTRLTTVVDLQQAIDQHARQGQINHRMHEVVDAIRRQKNGFGDVCLEGDGAQKLANLLKETAKQIETNTWLIEVKEEIEVDC